MALQLIDAVTDGTRRTVTKPGGILFGLLLATQLLLLASVNTAVAAEFPPEAADALGLTLPVSGTVASGLLFGAFLFTAIYFVLVARAFTRPQSELSSFPESIYTHRLGRATLSMLVGGIVVFFAVMIGVVLFVLPGLFLAASFIFFIFAVGVEDRGVIGGLKRSWGLARGNRLRLGLFVVLIGILGGVLSVPSAIFQAAGVPAVGDFVTAFLNSLVFTVIYGMMAAMYLQLRDGDGDTGTPGSQPSPLDQPAE